MFDSKKKVKATTADGLEHKLTQTQQRTMAFNRCLLFFYTNQVIVVDFAYLDLEYSDFSIIWQGFPQNIIYPGVSIKFEAGSWLE